VYKGCVPKMCMWTTKGFMDIHVSNGVIPFNRWVIVSLECEATMCKISTQNQKETPLWKNFYNNAIISFYHWILISCARSYNQFMWWFFNKYYATCLFGNLSPQLLKMVVMVFMLSRYTYLNNFCKHSNA
jgi:hypothetical protein